MSLYVQITDFAGLEEVPKDKYTNPVLQTYINRFEVLYLKHLLGASLYGEFATDFAITGTSPTAQRFIDIWGAFSVDDNCLLVISDGIKAMLVKFIYFEYLRDQNTQKNIGGITKNEQANSQLATFASTSIITIYNQAVDTYTAIQWFINQDLTVYPLFNGILKNYTIG